MLTAIALVLTFIAGYIIGNNMGVAKTMLRVQGLIMEMQAIVQMWEGHQEQWNEDQL
jgi:hypothetical protein